MGDDEKDEENKGKIEGKEIELWEKNGGAGEIPKTLRSTRSVFGINKVCCDHLNSRYQLSVLLRSF